MVTRAQPPRYRGRDDERRVLDAALADAASGRLAGVIIEGEPGIGKSRLLSEVVAASGSRDVQIVAGRAEELEQARPFGVLIDAFDSVMSSDPRRAAIAELLATRIGERGPMTVTSDPGLQFQVVDAFVDLVEDLALRRPLVVTVDDLQWADPSSLLTLDVLCRRLAYVPVALVVCLRPTPRSDQLQRVLETLVGMAARRLSLGRLDDDAVIELVADVVGAEPGQRLLAKVAAAGGNPLFVIELVSALVEEDVVAVVDGRAEIAESTMPPSLRLTILRRLSYLSASALDLLRAASLLGVSFTVAELSMVMTRSAFAVSSELEEVFAAGVLSDDGHRVRFRHDLIREAVYEDIPASVRKDLHRAAGQRLAAADASATRVAEHLARAAEPGDADAIAWLTTAAREAAPTSPGIASDLLERAIELTDAADSSGRGALLVERAGVLMWAGRIDEAEATCLSLLDRPHDPAIDASMRMCLGHCLMATGRMRPALQQLELVRRSSVATPAQQAVCQSWAGIAYASLGELDAAVSAADQARTTAQEIGDSATSSVASAALAVVAELGGHFREALEIVDEGLRCAEASADRKGHRYPHHLDRGRILVELDQLDDARAAFETGMRLSEQLGLPWQLSAYQTILAVERFVAGAWDDAIDAFEAGQRLAAEHNAAHDTLVLGHSMRALIALHRNDLPLAERAVSAATREYDDGYIRYRAHRAAWVRALLLEADGAIPDAYAMLAACWDRCATSGLAVEYPVVGPDLVRVALAIDERERAAAVTDAVAAVAGINRVPSLTGAALRCQGLRDDDPDTLLRAVDAYARSPRPLELALTREDAAMVLAANGDVGGAVRLLDEALDGYEQLDAERDVARTRAALRKLGVNRGQPGTRQRPRTGWASLTPTERTVSDLVAEGLSNPQIGERLFVSRRTVQTHLAHVFRKLQMSSRSELAAEVARRRELG